MLQERAGLASSAPIPAAPIPAVPIPAVPIPVVPIFETPIFHTAAAPAPSAETGRYDAATVPNRAAYTEYRISSGLSGGPVPVETGARFPTFTHVSGGHEAADSDELDIPAFLRRGNA